MEKRTQKRFVYEGFGFPVVLRNVPMVKVRGVWTPKVDFNQLARSVLEALALHPARLSGHEVKFVRHFFEMTLDKFAERFGVSHPAVLKWERTADAPAKMSWGTEKDLRLFILDELGAKAQRLAATYRKLARPVGTKSRRITMDLAA
ncbi:hypothetical protein ACFL6C_11385 [Myxococcota bacterium]